MKLDDMGFVEMSRNIARTPLPMTDRASWFYDHYYLATAQVAEFLAGDGIALDGSVVGDIGCGDGIIDLGLAVQHSAAMVYGFDQIETDVDALIQISAEFGVIDGLPANLQFHNLSDNDIPAFAEGICDVVLTWSVFEHAADPLALAYQVKRLLRKDGVAVIQVWPMWYSQHGAHLWKWFPQGFVHLYENLPDLERYAREHPVGDSFWDVYMLNTFRSCNRITVDEIQDSLVKAGLRVGRVQLISHAFHVPEQLQHVPISRLGIAGVMLLASPLY